MNPEINKFVQSIAKRVYPETEKEKNCINEFGKMIIKRGQLSKAIINIINEKANEQEQLSERSSIRSAG